MKRITAFFLAVLILAGCGKKDNGEAASLTAYEGYYQSVLETTHFSDESRYFDLELDLVHSAQGKYLYYVVIDDPQIAMYNIKALIVEDLVPFAETSKMMPTLGIFGTDVYHMIPYQNNKNASYYKGIVLSGESDGTVQQLYLVIEWTDRTRTVYNRQYFTIGLDYSKASSGGGE